jgi:hypothetical protein
MPEEDTLHFVQFIHDGPEHGWDEEENNTKRKRWNRAPRHRRKFLVYPGRCIRGEKSRSMELAFWGEWEAESDVREIDATLVGGPKYVHTPYWVPRRSYAGLQNTDPFVFGLFLYGICKQASYPVLRHLKRGSLILFGSHLDRKFVLDTVFVVDRWVDYDRHSYKTRTRRLVPDGYLDVGLKPFLQLPTNGACGPSVGTTNRLYFGATQNAPFDDMFSFFPCVPWGKGERTFGRPRIQIPGFISDGLRQGIKVGQERSRQVSQSQIKALWDEVVGQVLKNDDLWLGVNANMPERRRDSF